MIGDTTASPTAAREEAAIRSRLVLVRNARNEAILLVEGPTDVPFWRLVGREKVFLIQCDGREAVIKELRAVHAGGAIPGLLAVIDADWDHIEGTRHDLPDLFKTDTRDLESLFGPVYACLGGGDLAPRRPRRAQRPRGVPKARTSARCSWSGCGSSGGCAGFICGVAAPLSFTTA